jgi:threonyl-tRNA synthetase
MSGKKEKKGGKEGMSAFWHSTSHIMAGAVKRLWPDAKLAIGPAVEDGFYYDFDKKEPFIPADLETIEKEMKKIIEKNSDFKHALVERKEAEKILKNEPYKLELLKEISGKKVSFYQNDDFMELCDGPHIPKTGEIKAFRLLRTAGAYWRGDPSRKMLQRIYGISFGSQKEMDEFLKMREEAEKRDHSKLGRELDLYVTNPAVGKGLPLFTPKGATIKRILQRWIEDEEIKRGYQFTSTPILAKTDLYKISGHLEHYRDKMFIFKTEEGEEIALRPMTCPYHFMIYKSRQRSYKELPVRYAETASLCRYEKSGELHGLSRIWQFTLADAHIICKPDQLEGEFENVLDLIQYIMKTLGFKDYWYRFSKWDPKDKKKYIDNPKAWNESQRILKKILDKNKLRYEEIEGDAAFYGPKLDIQMKNVWGKEDTIFTVQIDFALPERFGMAYVDKDNKEARPMVIHRSSIGCYERTIAMLIEHYAGAFPAWLAPVQAKILTITDDNTAYAKKIEKQLRDAGIRLEVNYEATTLQLKIRNAQLEKVPYMLIIGDKEQKNDTLAVRTRDGRVSYGVKPDDFLKDICTEIELKK